MKMQLMTVLESIESPHAVTSSIIVEAVINSFDKMVLIFFFKLTNVHVSSGEIGGIMHCCMMSSLTSQRF